MEAGCAIWSPGAHPGGLLAEFFHGVGLPIIEGYGLTETAPIVTMNPPDAPRRHGRKASAARRAPHRADGEILVRGPNLMNGYYNKPEATADAIKDGGSTPATSAASTPTDT